ncbi:hypothetical protein Mal65_02040 [Crateriforma conspicua]|nr:hypothetical protein Mal65_02040 [Crateriforma conspicua]
MAEQSDARGAADHAVCQWKVFLRRPGDRDRYTGSALIGIRLWFSCARSAGVDGESRSNAVSCLPVSLNTLAVLGLSPIRNVD